MQTMQALSLVTAGASGVMGGVLFGFSSFVMPGLRRLPATDAVAAMQAINKAAPRALGLPLVVSGLGSAAVGAWSLTQSASAGSPGPRALLLAGAAAGVVAFAVTVGYHIPRNDRLDAVDARSSAAAGAWADYVPGWVAMNHVRTALSLASAALVAAGVIQLP
ncbi:DUF1772 domain-containing protein [Intrasporangium sp.]|uniref:anthrone oxygenase family protein n=1 Tax=Intrasporangium sp. TaxID=1925024 RepID=UPI0029399AC7|nr:anthrone oxygenase family protein [Intrasporangium sp.]MDV3220541.1 DUF1772 domain-containing protein [Intrasporangium sp.]